METKVAPAPSVRSAFTALIDYAGLFPPAKLSLADALAEYGRARTGRCAWMLGRFIIPASLLNEAPPALTGGFSVILDDGLSSIPQLGELRKRGARIEALEVPPRVAAGEVRASLERAGLSDLPVFVEGSEMAALARCGFGAKLRCGGVTAEAFPSVDAVAEFVAAACAANVPFKATAGLHHPVRHVDEATGFSMHGFLNLLAAAALAPRVEIETLRRVVGEEDAAAFRFEPNAFAWRKRTIDAAALHDSRSRFFVSYGSCSFSEPVEDLTVLGVLSSK